MPTFAPPRPLAVLAVTLDQAATMLGYSHKRTIQRLIAAGKLRTIGAGSGLRVTVASIEAYAQQVQRDAT